MSVLQKITPCLWFDDQAEEAARFYVSIFENSSIGAITHYGKEGFEIHGRPAGSVLTVNFRLEGEEFTALNGGPHFKFTEALSFVVRCHTQAEIDYYWQRLGEGGDETARQCGWLKDKYGLSWQVTPTVIRELLSGDNKARIGRVTQAFLNMKKFDIAEIKRAAAGT